MSTPRSRLYAGLLLGLALTACSDDSAGKRASSPAEEQPGVSADAGATPGDKAVPLLAWVDDIIEKRSSDEALPDTVDDKNVEDTDDATAFDKYLQ